MHRRRRGGRDRQHLRSGDAARQGPRARHRAQGRACGGRARDRGFRRGLGGLAPAALGGARGGLPPGGGPARRPLALDPRGGDDAQPVEDRLPGRDRRGLRGDRLLALQRRVHGPDLRGAARLLARGLEPDGVPAARGLRLRGHAVQLHGDRREPLVEPRADGRRRALEAGLDRRLLVVLDDEAARGGRPAARRDQPRLRQRRRDRRPGPGERAPRRRPLHRLDRGLPLDLEDGRPEHRPLPQLPAHRRRDRRQGLHRRPPERGRRGGRDSDPARLVRVPGPEVLGSLARVRAREPLARAARAAGRGGRDDQDGRRQRLLELHGRRDRREVVRTAEGGDRARARRTTPR